MIRPSPVLRRLGALLCLGLTLLVAPNVVLCQAQGHVSLESLFGACCLPAPANSDGDSVHASECGSCTDVPLLGSADAGSPRTFDCSPAVSVTAVPEPPPIVASAALGRGPHDPGRGSAASVVLLI